MQQGCELLRFFFFCSKADQSRYTQSAYSKKYDSACCFGSWANNARLVPNRSPVLFYRRHRCILFFGLSFR